MGGLFVRLCLGRRGIMQDQICGRGQLFIWSASSLRSVDKGCNVSGGRKDEDKDVPRASRNRATLLS